jgi:hypothetical protein
MTELRSAHDGAPVRYFNTKETAGLIRLALKRAFPGVVFSVRTAYASCYSAVNVSWTDGPTVPEVERTTDAFSSRTFNGSDDSTTHFEQTVNGERVKYSGWINIHRHVSPELQALAERRALALGIDNVHSVLHTLRPNGVRVMLKEL